MVKSDRFSNIASQMMQRITIQHTSVNKGALGRTKSGCRQSGEGRVDFLVGVTQRSTRCLNHES